MAKVTVSESALSAIGNAIRSKLVVQTTYKPSEMATAIQSIQTATLGTKSISANGTYAASSDSVDGYSEVTVNVANSYVASDEGKVVSNGALVAQTGTTVTQNGTYDTTLNDEVVVNVSGGGSAAVQPLSVTQNGTYTPPSGVDGYAPVTVNVSGGGTSDNDLLFHFADFKNSGKMDAVFYNQTGYEISDEQSKFGGTSLKIKSNPATGGAVYFDSGFTIGSEDFTMDFWMYQTNKESQGNCLLSFNYRSFGFYPNAGKPMYLDATSRSTSWDTEVNIGSIDTLNEWHHIAFTRKDGVMSAFVDGNKVASLQFGSSFPEMTRLSFGTNSTDSSKWRGYIDEFRLKLGIAVWTEDFTPPTQPYE